MSDLRDLYQEVILDHGKRPRNFRHPADANREAKGDNPLCGDKVTIYLTLSKKGVIEDVAFEGRGCAISTLFCCWIISRAMTRMTTSPAFRTTRTAVSSPSPTCSTDTWNIGTAWAIAATCVPAAFSG